jgi:hypothetical protein
MYSPEMVCRFIKMIEKGNLKIGKGAGVATVGTYGLDEIQQALNDAKKQSGWGRQVVLIP